ncbi:MAG TPA: MFS transporter [Dehalococcoidia bacterium]|nr:MFS transporter [Dehalococcoidia bacterium]
MIRRYTARVFYGWWILAAGFSVQLLIGGVFQQSYGAYVADLQGEEGWSKTALAGAFSFTQLVGGLVAPFQGVVMDRVGPRAIMRVGFVIFGGGFMLLSQVHSLAAFYGAFVLLAVGFSFTAYFPLTVALVNWFERKRARALSTMSLGFGVSGLLVPAVALSIEHFGWRPTAFVSGVSLIVLGLPLAQVMRRRPEDYGEVPDGVREARDEGPAAAAAEASDAERDFTAAEALRTPAFWLISLGHGSALLVVGAVSVHAISHLTEDLDYSVSGAAFVVTLMTTMQVAGLLVGAAIGDRFDKRLIAAACMVMHMAGMLLVTFAVSFVMVVAFAVLHGLAWGIRGPLMQAIRADYFGRRSFGVIMGMSSTIIMVGQIAGPLVAGLLADSTGSYAAGFTLMAVLAGLGSGFFIFAKRPALPGRAPTPERAMEPV